MAKHPGMLVTAQAEHNPVEMSVWGNISNPLRTAIATVVAFAPNFSGNSARQLRRRKMRIFVCFLSKNGLIGTWDFFSGPNKVTGHIDPKFECHFGTCKQFCLSFVALWSQNGSFQRPQSCRGKPCWLNPWESGLEFAQGRGSWLHRRPCLVPSWCGSNRTTWDCCWPWGISSTPRATAPKPSPQKKREWQWVIDGNDRSIGQQGVMSPGAHFWRVISNRWSWFH